jgi:hypothetical protein
VADLVLLTGMAVMVAQEADLHEMAILEDQVHWVKEIQVATVMEGRTQVDLVAVVLVQVV